MAITYEIDRRVGVVFTTVSGVLTDGDLIAHKLKLTRDAAFKPGMVELSDARHVDRLEVTAAGVSRFVAKDLADAELLADFKLAIVAPQDAVFGMARMYQTRTADSPPQVRIFRGMKEARAWLGLTQETGA